MTSKHRNVPRRVDGHWFASGLEARRYQELKLLEYAGKIEDLALQQRYSLIVNRVPICTYVADFVYKDRETRETIVEDAKGRILPLYRIKKALMLAVYGIKIKEM